MQDRNHGSRRRAASSGASRHKKQQLIVVALLIGLLVALLTQPDIEDVKLGVPAGTTIPAQSLRTTNVRLVVDSPQPPPSHLLEVRELSRIELSEVTRFELFVPEPQRLRIRNRIENMQPVQAIYGSSSQRSALVGEAIIRRGQPLPDGHKVLDITDEGVRLEP